MSNVLYVTDLDGTLLKDDKTISNRTVRIINDLIAQGALITYATARTIESSSKITHKINFNIPVINRNGTVLSNPVTKAIVDIEAFDKAVLSDIRKKLQGYHIPGFVTAYVEGKEVKSYISERSNAGFRQYIEEHKGDKRLRAVVKEEDLYEGTVCYFTFIAPKEELVALYHDMGQSKKWNCIFQQDKYSSNYWLEICPANATKASAIQKLKESHNCDIIVVFGDSLNDLSMFEVADESYAVGNAMDELKEIATGVIESNNDDGVALFLEKRFCGLNS